MADESQPGTTRAPDIFSRGSLKLTYDLIRPENAQLALNVRNITGGEPLLKEASQQNNPHSDYFRVTLDSFQVRSIVEGLMAQVSSAGESNPGQAIIAKALIEDWTSLARKMFSELPENEDT